MNPLIHSIVLEGYVSYKNLRKNHQLCIRVIIYIFFIEETNHKLFFRVMITQEKSAVFEWLLPVILSGPQMMLSSGLSSTSSDLCVRHYNYFYTPPHNQKIIWKENWFYKKLQCTLSQKNGTISSGAGTRYFMSTQVVGKNIREQCTLYIYTTTYVVPVPCSGTKNQRQTVQSVQ